MSKESKNASVPNTGSAVWNAAYMVGVLPFSVAEKEPTWEANR